MTSPALKHELVKLRIVRFLSDTTRKEHGATIDSIKFGIEQIRTVNTERVLAEMTQDGLVERRQDARDARTRPFFLTERGADYLKQQDAKVFDQNLEPDQKWSATLLGDQLRQLLTRHLRHMPEFHATSEERISEVSRELADAISSVLGRASERPR